MSNNDKRCMECGCMYFHEPDIIGEKECCFPFFAPDEDDIDYKYAVCWAEQKD